MRLRHWSNDPQVLSHLLDSILGRLQPGAESPADESERWSNRDARVVGAHRGGGAELARVSETLRYSTDGGEGELIEPGVRLIGDGVQLGRDVSICAPAEIMAKGSRIVIGDGCDIAGFVTITTADSHKRCLGISPVVERREVILGEHVFVGQGAI